jgi:hypothetical protein
MISTASFCVEAAAELKDALACTLHEEIDRERIFEE